MAIDHLSSNSPRLNLDSKNLNIKTSDKLVIENDKVVNKDRELNESKISKEEIEEVVKQMNQFLLQPNRTSVKFQLHEELKEYYVSVIDEASQEVIREIPSKKLLDVYAAMTEFLGLVVDKKI
ncbi:flagellar protein FlaG [Bacillus mesophilus]|uniref:Flagellar protein FlaG n=1 Tax=Bacillus mesophilus TaxID=1808955 RepID=A0A6M0Q7I7_9BACI|nr:flagellar protein FlaG [Bacillus mesophilus]MBM7661584.1 flagellar protein FlaG [Bacillus mesophilus]NEY72253.1 flagellar protein FlaG [Bacillus mesophilus]